MSLGRKIFFALGIGLFLPLLAEVKEHKRDMEIVTLKGEEILPYLDTVADLRINIFSEWPYYYEGDLKSEKVYLKEYAKSNDAILVLAIENERAVGLAMGVPVSESMQQVRDVFDQEGVDPTNAYYFGDAILYKEYRGQKIGYRLIKDFERAVSNLNRFDKIYFVEIVRDSDDPRKPETYQSLDPFWDRLNYYLVPGWGVNIKWLDFGDSEKSDHYLRFRMKEMEA